jgi:hypothetical protein
VTVETISDQQEHAEKYPPELLAAIPNGTIFAYNLDEKNNAGGMRVRWKIRVANGPEAARAEARQAEAIREALTWLRKHPQAKTAR